MFFFCFKFIQIFVPVNIFRQKYKNITARTKYYFCHARTDIGLLCEKRKLMLHLKLVGIILLTHVSFNCRRTETKHLKPLPSILYNYVNLYIALSVYNIGYTLNCLEYICSVSSPLRRHGLTLPSCSSAS